MGKNFLGLDGLKHFWTKAKTWIAGQITAEVTAKIAEIVANAPEDLDTLKEIADWIKTHANDASAMNTQITENKNDIAALQTSVAGKADKSHTHIKSEITDFPTSLKNPNALTVNGKTYDGSSAVNAGVQTVANGGTGATTALGAFENLANGLPEGAGPLDTEHIIFQNENRKNWGLYTLSHFWEYIKGKISSVLGLTKDSYGGKASTAGNADTVDNYHASQLWRSDGANWNPSANVTMTPSGNDSEWSFDFRNKNGATGLYWQVWDENKATLLRVDADSGKVSAPYGFVGNLSGKADTAGTADKTINDITIDVPYSAESGQYVIPLGNILEPTSTATESPYNWDITGFFSIIRPTGHNGSHLWFEAGHGYSHDWTTYAYLDKFDFKNVTTSIKAFQYNGKWWLGLCITTSNQYYTSKITVTYSRGLPATPTCILYNSISDGIANEEIYNSIQDIPSSWWRQRTICNPTSFSNTLHVDGLITPRQGTSDGATVSIGREDGNITIGDTNNNNLGYTTINNDCKMGHDLEVFGESNFVGPCFFNKDIFVHNKSLFPSGYVPRTYFIERATKDTITAEQKELLRKMFAYQSVNRLIQCHGFLKYRFDSAEEYFGGTVVTVGYFDGDDWLDSNDNIRYDDNFTVNFACFGIQDDLDDIYICDMYNFSGQVMRNKFENLNYLYVSRLSFTVLEKV